MMDLIRFQDHYRRRIYQELGIPTPTPTLDALASGADVPLTIFQGSGFEFQGLSRDDARQVYEYFHLESEKYADSNAEIGAFYRAWAETIKEHFLV